MLRFVAVTGRNRLINMCSNSYRYYLEEKTISLYHFPEDPEIYKKLVNACKRKDIINIKTAKICSLHFKPDDYARSLKHELLHYRPTNARKLKDDGIPTQNHYEKTAFIDPGMPM